MSCVDAAVAVGEGGGSLLVSGGVQNWVRVRNDGEDGSAHEFPCVSVFELMEKMVRVLSDQIVISRRVFVRKDRYNRELDIVDVKMSSV